MTDPAAAIEPPETGLGGRSASRGVLLFLAGFVGVVVVAAVWAASAGIRGSDQYWYLADVETLLRTGAATTTTIFPVGLLGPGGSLTPPFIHNVASIYLAAVPGLLVGGYGGWIVLNVVATLATAGLIYLAARTVASHWAAVLCAVAYPLLPVVFWHTTQPLAEASTAFFAALSIYLLTVAGDRPARWLGIVIAVGLLYYARDSYLPLLLAVPVGFLLVRVIDERGALRTAIGPTLGLAVATIAMVGLGQVLFPADNVAFSYGRLIHTAVPGQTDNMWFNFDLSSANLADRLPLQLDLLPGKFVAHLAEQFVRFDSVPLALFYWTFNLLAIVALVMLWRCRRRPLQRRVTIAALSFVAIHVVTITLFQNEVRYTVPALPGLLVVLAIAASGVPWLARIVAPRTLVVAVVIALVLLAPTVVIGRAQRAEAADFATVEAAARDLWTTHVGPTEPAILVYADRPQVLGYAADRRPVLYVSPAYTDAEYGRLRDAFGSHWLLAPIGSRAIAGLGAGTSEPVGTIDVFGDTWGLYALPD